MKLFIALLFVITNVFGQDMKMLPQHKVNEVAEDVEFVEAMVTLDDEGNFVEYVMYSDSSLVEYTDYLYIEDEVIRLNYVKYLNANQDFLHKLSMNTEINEKTLKYILYMKTLNDQGEPIITMQQYFNNIGFYEAEKPTLKYLGIFYILIIVVVLIVINYVKRQIRDSS